MVSPGRLAIIVYLSAACVLAQAQETLPVFHPSTFYSYGNPVKIYPEGFVRARGQKLLIDGGVETEIAAGADSAVVILSDQRGNSVKETLKITRTNVAVLDARRTLVLCIGESTTETVNPDPVSGSFEKGWNWVSMMKSMSLGHGADVVCLGTGTKKDAPLEACYTAHGGWSSYTYLNWPCAA